MVQTRAFDDTAPRRARKREILEAAARVFRRKGLQASGMRDIAAELGMAVGNLYYYFRDKDEILTFCQEDALDALLELATEVRSQPGGPQQRLGDLIRGHLRCLHEGTPGSVAHLEVEALSEASRLAVIAQRNRYEAAFREVIGDGVARGVFRPVDARLVARAILGALNWTARWYRLDGPVTLDAIGEEFAQLLVGGLLVAAGHASSGAGEAMAEPSGNKRS